MIIRLFDFVSEHIFFSLITGLIIIYVLIPYIRDVIDNKRMKKASDITQDKVDSLNSFVWGVSGPVGFGKTTMASGNAHGKVLSLLDHIEDVLKETQRLNWTINFNHLHEQIEKLMQKGLNTFEIQDEIANKMPYLFYAKHDIGTEIKNALDMLDEYVSAYIHSIKGITILSNTEFRCKLTGQLSKCYETDMTFMKDRYISGDWIIDDYTIIIDDDGNMDTLTTALNFQAYAKLDTGGSLWKRLLRQMHLGTVVFITTAQSIGRIVKEERELIPAQLNVEKKCYIACDYWRTQRNIERLLIKPCEFLERMYLRIKHGKEKVDRAMLMPNIFKRWLYKLTILQYKYFAKGYVVYPTIIDYGSDLIEPEHFDFVYPVTWCYGALNSTNFRYFQKMMVEASNKTIEEVADNDGSKEAQVTIFNKVISKRNEKAAF